MRSILILFMLAVAIPSYGGSLSAWRKCGLTKWIFSWNDVSPDAGYDNYTTRAAFPGLLDRACLEDQDTPTGCTKPFTNLCDGYLHWIRACTNGCDYPCGNTSGLVSIPTGSCIPLRSPGARIASDFEAKVSAMDQVIYLAAQDVLDNPKAFVTPEQVRDHMNAVIAYHRYSFDEEQLEWIFSNSFNAATQYQQFYLARGDAAPRFERPKELPPEWVPATK